MSEITHLTGPGPSEVLPHGVCVALPANSIDYDETGRILSCVVRELGYEVRLARDGDRSILDGDTLVLFGKCSAFTNSARLLATRRERRPTTVLWHIEPLLPEVIPETAERTCRLLARCDWSGWPRPLPEVVTRIPGTALLRDLVRKTFSAKLKSLCGWNDQPHSQIHPRQWFHAAQHYAWFRQWHSPHWCDLVAASTPARHEVLTRLGIRSMYAPLGYHREWGCDLGLRRDIDVLFLGRVKRTSRQAILDHVRRQLSRHGVELTVVDRACFGQKRTELLNRTRIILDVMQNAWEMPIVRLLTSMACGAMVISNWTSDPHPFRPEHLVQVDSRCLADAVLHYLGAERRRQRIARLAQQYVTQELTWQKTVSHMLQRCHRDTPAVKGVTV